MWPMGLLFNLLYFYNLCKLIVQNGSYCMIDIIALNYAEF